jgi:pantothenate kinase
MRALFLTHDGYLGALGCLLSDVKQRGQEGSSATAEPAPGDTQ